MDKPKSRRVFWPSRRLFNDIFAPDRLPLLGRAMNRRVLIFESTRAVGRLDGLPTADLGVGQFMCSTKEGSMPFVRSRSNFDLNLRMPFYGPAVSRVPLAIRRWR